jgi:secreted trypsin-like serine protease
VKQNYKNFLYLNFIRLFNSSFYTRENKANGCGLSNIRGPAQRIVGGRLASDGEFPWIISLHKNERFRCGGSINIIDIKTIVTAAHCVQGFVKGEPTLSHCAWARTFDLVVRWQIY